MEPSASPAAISIQGLTKTFGSKRALHNVSFEVPVGEIYGFLGPNGAGKTTTIRCLMDFIHPTKGSITILGKDAHEQSTYLKQKIGFLSSDQQLNPRWTGEDHIRLAAGIRGSQKHARELSKLLGYNPYLRVKALSTGNKQKLAIVLAFMGNPELLIMDEPTRGLDPMLQKLLYDLLRDYAKNGKTVFFSSHNLNEVQALCDSVAFIKDGKILTQKSMYDIRGMNVHIISATATKPFVVAELKAAGVTVVQHKGVTITIKVKGDFNKALRALARYELTDLDMTHANLEDIFLEQYKGEKA
jgi:ABC-2 type transport system ATP-binding protein